MKCGKIAQAVSGERGGARADNPQGIKLCKKKSFNNFVIHCKVQKLVFNTF